MWVEYWYLNSLFILFLIVLLINIFKNYINFNTVIKFYLYLLFVLFTISIFLQIKCYSSEVLYTTSIDYSTSMNSTRYTLLSFKADSLSCVFSTVTVQIAFFVNVYSFYYNKEESNEYNFFFLLNLFFTSMVLLLHSRNFVSLFFFWEMIGISSFLLINFYHYKTITVKSALKAMSFNKFSDFSMVAAAVVFYNFTNTLVFDNSVFMDFFLNQSCTKFFFFLSPASAFIVFVLVAAFIKSAQLGFHFWLPDSMEAPLPASALIHSATLVASGIYLVLRFEIFIESSVYVYNTSLFIFSITYVVGAVVSSAQTDVKKLLAYSTISNCGLMFIAALIGQSQNAYIFFTLHGYWKSCAFLLAGQILISSRHNQDLRFFFNKNFVNLVQMSSFIITAVGLVSFFLIHKSLCKHYLFENDMWLLFMRSTFLLGSFFSYFYCIKMFFLFSGDIIKFKKVEYNFNVYVVYNILIYLVLVFFNYFFYSSGYLEWIDYYFITYLLTVLSASALIIYYDSKRVNR